MSIVIDSDFDQKKMSRCCLCKNYDWDSETNRCRAFPDGIPAEIWGGEKNHEKPLPGDNGIMFEFNEKLKNK
jgi:hypothetical protein